jgi:hypothetical protein
MTQREHSPEKQNGLVGEMGFSSITGNFRCHSGHLEQVILQDGGQ